MKKLIKFKQIAQLGVLSVLLVAWMQCKPEADPNSNTGGAVEINVPSVNGSKAVNKTIHTVDQKNQTVLFYMKLMQTSGDLQFTSTGSDDKVLIDGLQDVKNEGMDGKNWMYTIDGRLADRGVAVMPLLGGQRLQWCYVTYAERESCGNPEGRP